MIIQSPEPTPGHAFQIRHKGIKVPLLAYIGYVKGIGGLFILHTVGIPRSFLADHKGALLTIAFKVTDKDLDGNGMGEAVFECIQVKGLGTLPDKGSIRVQAGASV